MVPDMAEELEILVNRKLPETTHVHGTLKTIIRGNRELYEKDAITKEEIVETYQKVKMRIAMYVLPGKYRKHIKQWFENKHEENISSPLSIAYYNR